MPYESSFSLSESVGDERVGEVTMVGRSDPSVEGVGEWWANRTKSIIWSKRENEFGNIARCLFSGGGMSPVAVTGDGRCAAPENEEPRFLGEQV